MLSLSGSTDNSGEVNPLKVSYAWNMVKRINFIKHQYDLCTKKIRL